MLGLGECWEDAPVGDQTRGVGNKEKAGRSYCQREDGGLGDGLEKGSKEGQGVKGDSATSLVVQW